MLLISAAVKVECMNGTNLAEQVQVGTKRVQTISGYKYDPVYTCKYVDGTPFDTTPSVLAPVALKVGDVVKVNADGGEVIEVQRGDQMAYKKGKGENERTTDLHGRK